MDKQNVPSVETGSTTEKDKTPVSAIEGFVEIVSNTCSLIMNSTSQTVTTLCAIFVSPIIGRFV